MTIKVGFPHSDTLGSKLVCQLPEAYRRLPRPSSPVIAKASTTCTYSLDPIALTADTAQNQGYRTLPTFGAHDAIYTHHPSQPLTSNLVSSKFLKNKEQLQQHSKDRTNRAFGCRRSTGMHTPKRGGGERDRTDDLLLAKQALSQLSYTPEIRGGSGWI